MIVVNAKKKKIKKKKRTDRKKWFNDAKLAGTIIKNHGITGIQKWVLICKLDISLASFSKLQPIILDMNPSISYNKKSRKFIYSDDT